MTLGIVQQLRGAAGTLQSYSARKGWRGTLLAIARNLIQPLVRHHHHFIWEADLDAPRSPSPWAPDEQFSIIGPETLSREMTPQLRRFLGGETADGDLAGVQAGDRLLLITIGSAYAYSGYIYFNTTAETLRQKKIYGEPGDAPVIGSCVSTPARIWSGPAKLPPGNGLAGRLCQLLPADADLAAAADGFKNLGQFVYTAFLAHNLQIPFAQLKARVVAGENLWNAVKALQPGVDAMAEVKQAWEEASLHRRVLNDVFFYLKQLGYRRAINDVVAHNLASHKANEAVGMKVCRELRDWTVLRHLVIQRIKEDGRYRWRVFAI